MFNSVKICGVGISCIDHVVLAPGVVPGGTVAIGDYRLQGGGLVATALVTCAHLGAKTELLTVTGEDSIGGMIAKELRAEGIGLKGLKVVAKGKSPFSIIHVDQNTGERTIFHRHAEGLAWPGGEMDVISTSGVMLLDDYYPQLTRRAVDIADKARIPMVADTSPTHENEDLLKKVTVVIAPRQFVSEGGFGDDLDAALDAIHAAGPSTAVITLGDQGWVASDSRGRYRGTAFKVAVSDTLGAGDVFHGAFAFALAKHLDTARCAEFAAAVDAIKCTHIGGWHGIPCLNDAMMFLRQNSQRDWPSDALDH